MSSALLAIRSQFEKATRFADIFGPVLAADLKERKALLKKQYATLAKLTHPDHAEAKDVSVATAVFAELSGLYRKALLALDDGSYEQSFVTAAGVGSSAYVSIKAGATEYQLDQTPFREGDFSNLHLGEVVGGEKVVAKIAVDPTLNPYLANEANLLSKAEKDLAGNKVLSFLPKLLDSVVLTEAGNEQYRVNLFGYKPGYVSLTEIREVYKDGLAPEEAAWIWRRVLGQTLLANMLGTVHGAIVPDHVLVHPVTHEPLHIGWAHAVKHGAKLNTIIDRWRDWYPPEVMSKEVSSHQTDLYMAGKTMLYLLGGDVARNRFPSHVPEPVVRIVKRCLEAEVSRRPSDGRAVLDEFLKIIEKLWGRKYRPLRLS